MLLCPVCHAPLRLEDTRAAFCCDVGHSFDRAREGYVNLARSRQRGDTSAMARARRAFLAAGHYGPLVEAVAARVVTHALSYAGGTYSTDLQGCGVLDAGCGEGYYLAHVQRALLEVRHTETPCLGLDISRDAIRLAARHAPACQFAVADVTAALPLASDSTAVILSIFAPRNPSEFARVVLPGGLLLVVIPQPAHLAELRAQVPLLAIEAGKREHVEEQLAPAFALHDERALVLPLTLDGTAIQQVVGMSPSARHLAPATYATLHALPPQRITAAFTLLAFERVRT